MYYRWSPTKLNFSIGVCSTDGVRLPVYDVLQMKSYKIEFIEFFYRGMFYGWSPSAYMRCATDGVLLN